MEPKRVIFLSLMICYIGLGVINPVLAPLIREIGLDEMHAGWIISASALVLLLSAPIWGHQSDRFGRKPIMIIGLIGFTFSLVLFAWLAWIGLQGKIELTFLFILLLLSRTLFGLFFPAMTSSGQALMADLTPLNERAAGMAMIGAASGIGFLIGPAMGAALAGIHLLFPIVVAAVLSLFAALLVYARIPRFTPKSSGERNKLNLRKPGIRPYLLIALCLMSALVMLQVTAGFYVQDKFGLNSKDTALWVGISLFCVGSFVRLRTLFFTARCWRWVRNTGLYGRCFHGIRRRGTGSSSRIDYGGNRGGLLCSPNRWNGIIPNPAGSSLLVSILCDCFAVNVCLEHASWA